MTEHALVDLCGMLPKEALQGVVLAKQSGKPEVTLREEGRLKNHPMDLETVPVAECWCSQAVHGARQAETAVREVLEQVRASPVVQGDETGWRQDGSNGYVWTFSTANDTPASGSG